MGSWFQNKAKAVRDYWLGIRSGLYSAHADRTLETARALVKRNACMCIMYMHDEHRKDCVVGQERDVRIREQARFEADERVFELEDELEDLKIKLRRLEEEKNARDREKVPAEGCSEESA